MEIELVNSITETTEGYLVKNLKWNQLDNILVGQVKDPITGRETLHDGFITAQWTRYGKPLKQNKGRTDLILKINY
jgi:hypothetical protein